MTIVAYECEEGVSSNGFVNDISQAKNFHLEYSDSDVDFYVENPNSTKMLCRKLYDVLKYKGYLTERDVNLIIADLDI